MQDLASIHPLGQRGWLLRSRARLCKGKMQADTTRAGRTIVAEEQVPNSWIGEQILVITIKRGSRTLCELKGVNDRGVVVEYRGATRFHPWSCISTLQLGEVK
jgi:hypothetical protein